MILRQMNLIYIEKTSLEIKYQIIYSFRFLKLILFHSLAQGHKENPF